MNYYAWGYIGIWACATIFITGLIVGDGPNRDAFNFILGSLAFMAIHLPLIGRVLNWW